MKRRVIFLQFVIAALVLSNCSAGGTPAPTKANTKTGVFLKSGDTLTELNRVKGEFQQTGIPKTKDTQPIVQFYLPLDDVKGIQLNGASNRVDFDTLSAQDGVFEIKPSHPLLPGAYCLVLGGSMTLPTDVSYWCFEATSMITPTPDPGLATFSATATAVHATLQKWKGVGDFGFEIEFFIDPASNSSALLDSYSISIKGCSNSQWALGNTQVEIVNNEFEYVDKGWPADNHITGKLVNADRIEGTYRIDTRNDRCEPIEGTWTASPQK